MFPLLLLAASGEALGSQPQLLNAETVFRPTDYPRQASRQKAAVRLVLEASVSPDGKLLGCEVVVSTGEAGEDQRLCEVAKKRAQFAAARDAEGQRIAGSYYLIGTWFQSAEARPIWPRLDADVTLEVASLPDGKQSVQVSITQIILPNGEIESCFVSSPSGVADIDARACALIPRHMQKAPIRDKSGVALRSRRTTRALFEVN